MKVLVTGASGRLGPYVVRELEQAGHDLVLMSRREPPEDIRRWPWVQGDVTVFDDCRRALADGADAIQHVAAQPYPTDHPSMREHAGKRGHAFDATMRSNIMGLYYLLQAAVEKEVGVFVMTGSNCALGHGFRISERPFPYHYLPIDEVHPTDCEDSYSFSKLAGEDLLDMYSRAYNMRTYALRSAGIWDAERRRQHRENVGPAKAWDGWLWAWVGSEDVALAHRLLMERAPEIDAHGVFFCNGDDTSALAPTRDLVAAYRPDLLPVTRELDGHATLLSNRRLHDAVGWAPRTSWRDA